MAGYPTRPKGYRFKFENLIYDLKLATRIGGHAAHLLTIVVVAEDRHYCARERAYVMRAAEFHIEELMERLQIKDTRTLNTAIARAVDAGWLYYEKSPQGSKRKGVFWTLIPDAVTSEMKRDLVVGSPATIPGEGRSSPGMIAGEKRLSHGMNASDGPPSPGMNASEGR